MTSPTGIVRGIIALLACMTVANLAPADLVTFSAPNLDRPMYPFTPSPGSATRGFTFGAFNTAGAFDERDAQFLVAYNTSSSITTGQGATNYSITSAILRVTIQEGDFVYDPTYDSYRTYLDPINPLFLPDTTPGRPIELYGVGFRNGRTMFDFVGGNPATGPGFEENESFGIPGPPAAGTRNAFAIDVSTGVQRDVSSNVDSDNDGAGGFDPTPFAIGQMNLTPGAQVPEGTEVEFLIDINDPHILAYLQNGLNNGQLGFMITSLHPAEQGGPQTYPSYDTKEAFFGIPASLVLEVTIVPEPGALALLGLAGVVGAGLMVQRRRSRTAKAAVEPSARQS